MKTSTIRLFVLALATLFTGTLCAVSVKIPKEDFHLYLLVGQSNMAGRGKISEADKKPHPRVFMFTKEKSWMPAVAPLHFDKPIAGTGLGRTFGIRMAETKPHAHIGLIPCAAGGSPIRTWEPGGYHGQTKSHPWDDAIARAKAAMVHGTLKGILWHQGESDSNEKDAPAYEEKLHDLVARFRKELGAPDVPFIAGQMGIFAERPWSDAKKQVDQAHRDLPRKIHNTAFVSADGLGHKGDKIHFSASSFRTLGHRYAKAYFAMVSARNRPNILFAIADDWSFGHAGAYGCKWVSTPAFDRVARDGILFNRAYTPNAKCAPSRAILLTGRYSWQLEEAANHMNRFPAKFGGFVEALEASGYFTGYTGKGWGPGIANDAEGRRHLDFHDGVKKMREEPDADFPLGGHRPTKWLYAYILGHGGSFDARQTKWATEQKIDVESAAYHVRDMLGMALEMVLTFDQLDVPNIAAMEVVARTCQLVEETAGTMRVEGLEHFKGRDVSGSIRRGIALAPQLAKHTTDRLAAQTEILKQRRKAKEEAANAKKTKP